MSPRPTAFCSTIALLAAVCWLPTLTLRAEPVVTIDHNGNAAPEADFHFKTVPAPRRSAAIDAKFSVVEGEPNPYGGSVGLLHNGDIPVSEDQPEANFFFSDDGGRVLADLGQSIPVKEVDTYSWHIGVRAPQVYKLYGSDGGGAGFVPEPKRPQDPATLGWKLLATVDTRPPFQLEGGQYGVSVTDATGLVGNYRYLLFDVAKTDAGDVDGNTFFSEIAVLNRDTADNPLIKASVVSKTYAENGLQLTVTNNDPAFDPAEQERMVKTFFAVYPLEMKEFNPDAAKRVHLSIETRFLDPILENYRGFPGVTTSTTIHLTSSWFRQHQEDLDVVTHEAMHVVQWSNRQWKPGWLVEGIADYARAKLGVNNGPADWTMPDYDPKQNYTDSYRVTARFFVWLEKHVKSGITAAVYQSMQQGDYSTDTWKKLTDKSVDELWQEYAKNPVL